MAIARREPSDEPPDINTEVPEHPPVVTNKNSYAYMEEAMQQSPVNFAAGDIVKGTIIEGSRNKEVLVDIGYKSEDRFRERI